jgi:hypothetical protein
MKRNFIKPRKLAIVSLLLVAGLTSCNEKSKPNYKKPFIIIFKEKIETGKCCYHFQDAQGFDTYFYDTETKYSIGDTIH